MFVVAPLAVIVAEVEQLLWYEGRVLMGLSMLPLDSLHNYRSFAYGWEWPVYGWEWPVYGWEWLAAV
jgi:hypothetical protein